MMQLKRNIALKYASIAEEAFKEMSLPTQAYWSAMYSIVFESGKHSNSTFDAFFINLAEWGMLLGNTGNEEQGQE